MNCTCTVKIAANGECLICRRQAKEPTREQQLEQAIREALAMNDVEVVRMRELLAQAISVHPYTLAPVDGKVYLSDESFLASLDEREAA